MSSSNSAPPQFGGTGNTGSGFQGANDSAGSTGAGAPASTTNKVSASAEAAASAAAAAQVNALGGVTTAAVPAPGGGYGLSTFQKIASQPVIEGGMAGSRPATPAVPYDEKQLVQSLATTLDVKAGKGQSLEEAVVNKLADRFGVNIKNEGTTTSGTGTGQGAVGQMRHNIASWFSTAAGAVGAAVIPGQAAKQEAANTKQLDKQRDEAMKIKDPRLRQMALKKLNDTGGLRPGGTPRLQQGNAPSVPEPVDAESSKALQQILGQVATKLGVQGAGPNALEDIAKNPEVNAPYEMPAHAAVGGTPQTYAQNFQAFAAAWQKNGKLSNGQTFQNQWINNLENMGELNAASNTANFGQSQTTVKGGVQTTTQAQQAKPTQDQVFNAYQQFLVDSQTAAQSPLVYMQNAPNDPAVKALKEGPASEMFAYVQGVAQEMGVGLTTNQLNQISNFYGASASVADDPASVADQIKDAVVALYSPPSDPNNPNSPNAYGVVNPSGVANTMYTNIQSQALAYQVPVSAGQITQMVQSDLQGASVASLYAAADAAQARAQQTFQMQAEGLYPALAAQIKQGSTVQQLTAPYLNVAEAITGVPSSTMQTDMTTGGVSKWGAFLQGGNNPAAATQINNSTGAAQAGQPQMMTLDQWKTYLMQNPQYGFQKTQGAQDMAEQMSSAILNTFGKVNTTSSPSPIQSLYGGQSDLSANTSSA